MSDGAAAATTEGAAVDEGDAAAAAAPATPAPATPAPAGGAAKTSTPVHGRTAYYDKLSDLTERYNQSQINDLQQRLNNIVIEYEPSIQYDVARNRDNAELLMKYFHENAKKFIPFIDIVKAGPQRQDNKQKPTAVRGMIRYKVNLQQPESDAEKVKALCTQAGPTQYTFIAMRVKWIIMRVFEELSKNGDAVGYCAKDIKDYMFTRFKALRVTYATVDDEGGGGDDAFDDMVDDELEAQLRELGDRWRRKYGLTEESKLMWLRGLGAPSGSEGDGSVSDGDGDAAGPEIKAPPTLMLHFSKLRF